MKDTIAQLQFRVCPCGPVAFNQNKKTSWEKLFTIWFVAMSCGDVTESI